MAITTGTTISSTENNRKGNTLPNRLIGGTDNDVKFSVFFKVSTDPIRVFGFGLEGDDKFKVYRVYLDPDTPLPVTPCGKEEATVEVLYEKPYTVNGVPVEGSGDDEILLDGTGTFYIEYEGDRLSNIAIFAYKEKVTKIE